MVHFLSRERERERDREKEKKRRREREKKEGKKRGENSTFPAGCFTGPPKTLCQEPAGDQPVPATTRESPHTARKTQHSKKRKKKKIKINLKKYCNVGISAYDTEKYMCIAMYEIPDEHVK